MHTIDLSVRSYVLATTDDSRLSSAVQAGSQLISSSLRGEGGSTAYPYIAVMQVGESATKVDLQLSRNRIG